MLILLRLQAKGGYLGVFFGGEGGWGTCFFAAVARLGMGSTVVEIWIALGIVCARQGK